MPPLGSDDSKVLAKMLIVVDWGTFVAFASIFMIVALLVIWRFAGSKSPRR